MSLQTDPFRSARLFYRPIRGPEDDAFFAEINEDRIGYMNSNISNNRLPLPSDAERFRKSMDNNIIAAIICLPERVTKEQGGRDEFRAGLAIGQVHLDGNSPRTVHHRNTEVGIDILPAYQGQGYGSEAIRWVLDYAFKRTGLHKVRIRAFEWNEGACRLYPRLGFVEEGREREAMWHQGRFWDSVTFGMLDREWWAMEEARVEKEKTDMEERRKKDESGVPMI